MVRGMLIYIDIELRIEGSEMLPDEMVSLTYRQWRDGFKSGERWSRGPLLHLPWCGQKRLARGRSAHAQTMMRVWHEQVGGSFACSPARRLGDLSEV